MDQSTHIVRKAKWLSVIEQCQKRPIDMTVRQWLADNGINSSAVAIIRIKDISIELTNDVSNDLLGRILEGINHA